MKFLAPFFSVMLAAGSVAAQGASSDGIPQYLKAGPGCNAFWMPGPSGWDGDGRTTNPQGQWYAIRSTDSVTNPPDPNAGGRWQLVVGASMSGRQLWVASPSGLGINPVIAPETLQCKVPPPGGGFGGQLPNAQIYLNPDNPFVQ